MSPSQKFPFTEPNMTDLQQLQKQSIFSAMNCVKIGEIRKFDGSKKTAEVQILFKRVLPDQSTRSYPILIDVPVFTLQGGGGAVQLPIEPGDQCLVLFSDRHLDAWYNSGSESVPFDARCHDLSDGIALVGVNALTSPMEDYVAEQLTVFLGAAEIALKANKIRVKNGTTDLLTLMIGFIDVLTAISTVPGGGPLNAASITALNAYKLQFQALLYT